MKRKIKMVGASLLAVLGMTAMATTPAQAQFTSSAASNFLNGYDVWGITFTAGTGVGGIQCSSVNYLGVQSGKTSSTWTLEPWFSLICQDSLGRSVHLENETLQYHFLSGANKGKVELTGGVTMTVTGSPHCTIKITGPQTLNGVTYTNNGNGTVTITTHTNNITSSISGGFFACGTAATHSSTGTLVGRIDVNGGGATISVD